MNVDVTCCDNCYLMNISYDLWDGRDVWQGRVSPVDVPKQVCQCLNYVGEVSRGQLHSAGVHGGVSFLSYLKHIT